MRSFSWYRWLTTMFGSRRRRLSKIVRGPRRFLPRLEMLEERVVPAHFYTVSGFADCTSGTVATTGGGIDGSSANPFVATTLRAAVNAANGDAGSTITLPAGTYNLTVGTAAVIGSSDANNSKIVNTATVTTTTATNTGTTASSVTTTVGTSADLSVVKTGP